MGGAIFPTYRKRDERGQPIIVDGVKIGMYDDNATAHWALMWSHGFASKCPSGWSIAHIWTTKGDLKSFTHLANLMMIPECFAGLTDKQGPLTVFLRWHAWNVYGWRPESSLKPSCPEGYGQIKWRYFEPISDPVEFIRNRVRSLSNQRMEILRPLLTRFE